MTDKDLEARWFQDHGYELVRGRWIKKLRKHDLMKARETMASELRDDFTPEREYEYRGDELKATTVKKRESLKLYIYGIGPAAMFHAGGQWFTSGGLKYPNEEISAARAKIAMEVARRKGVEVRVCNGLDYIVFHAVGDKVLHPEGGTWESFWEAM